MASSAPAASGGPVARAVAPAAAGAQTDNVIAIDQPRPSAAVASVPEMRPDPGHWTLEGLAGELSNSGQLMLGSLMRREGRVVSITPGVLTLSRQSRLTEADVADFSRALTATLQSPWVVELSDADGAATLAEQAATANAAAEEELRAHPLVAAVIRTFPDAELVRRGGDERGVARDARS
jgi:DNA polymerase-3 subunit gamma/tau